MVAYCRIETRDPMKCIISLRNYIDFRSVIFDDADIAR